jgi:hypothetical protein
VKTLSVLLCAVALGTLTVSAASASSTAENARCHASYKGACLKVGIGDYDCGGGSGNGPNYVWKTVRVVGPDVFGLDADHDRYGCEIN